MEYVTFEITKKKKMRAPFVYCTGLLELLVKPLLPLDKYPLDAKWSNI